VNFLKKKLSDGRLSKRKLSDGSFFDFSFLSDRQVKRYWYFQICFLLLCLFLGTGFVLVQGKAVQSLMLSHDNAVVTSLMEQGISKKVIATALTGTDGSEAGARFLSSVGRTDRIRPRFFPLILQFQRTTGRQMLTVGICLGTLLLAGTFLFLWKRDILYRQARDIISGFVEGDYSRHLPQSGEGTVYQLFALTDQLATMLQAENEAERRQKEFLKNTISDISHQLKTPLAALVMYQEILEEEPDHTETVKEFSEKMGVSLKRMDQLIASLLKITRLDAGNIVFEKKAYQISELILNAVGDLLTRAKMEKKEILMEGPKDARVICDMEWTSEAVGNIVKNALDHTGAGGKIRITYDCSPYMARIRIVDNGCGISPEDIYHVFKRFYRSRNSLDTQGAGLGLPLAKSIIEGQGGTIFVQSSPGEGTTFTVSMLTKL